MKDNRLHPRVLIPGLLGFLISLCCVGCTVTGFGLSDCPMGTLVLFCIAAAVVGTILSSVKWGAAVTALLLAAAAGFLWYDGNFVPQLSTLLYRISSRYASAYGWVVVGEELGSAPWYPLAAMGAAAAVLTVWSVSRHRGAGVIALPVALCAGSCFVVTDTVPDSGYLFGLLLGLTLLVLLESVGDQAHWDHLAVYAEAVLAAALLALFLLVPRQGYESPAAGLRELVVEHLPLNRQTDTPQQVPVLPGSRVDLRSAGPRWQSGIGVMEVTAGRDGTVYLRRQDYNTYSGIGWIASEYRTEALPGGQGDSFPVEIDTGTAKPELFVPDYPAQPLELSGGHLENTEKLTRYTFDTVSEPDATPWPDGQYRQLPTDTFAWALETVGQITDETDTPAARAGKIRDFVRSSAEYNLNTSAMPAGETDFARWFLQSSDTGYCVHYATLAAVLLRGAGIPARYVEGYLVSCRAGEPVTVTDRDAHAWVEYYDGTTWKILEATPGGADPEPEPTATETETAATEATRPTASDPEPEAPPTGTAPPQPSESPVPPEAEKKNPAWLPVITVVVLLAALLVLQSLLRRYRKRVAWRLGRPNKRALNRWAQVEQTARLLGEPVPEALRQLAEKAKFSQHTLTKEELAAFDGFRQTLEEKLRRQSLLRRIFLRLTGGL